MFNAFNTILHARDGGPSDTAYNFIVNTATRKNTHTLYKLNYEFTMRVRSRKLV